MEFELYIGSHEAQSRFDALPAFTRDYITAAFWTDATVDMWGDGLPEERERQIVDSNGDPLDDFAKLDAVSLQKMVDDCEEFMEGNTAELAEYEERTGYTGGCDFWLTRNGHGAGFWDRGVGALGAGLTIAAKAFGDQSLGTDGETVYAQ